MFGMSFLKSAFVCYRPESRLWYHGDKSVCLSVCLSACLWYLWADLFEVSRDLFVCLSIVNCPLFCSCHVIP
ncbi:hypothetical protein BDD12DRAFT_853546 [Trichophaea hybrida]|nr:hypothetical protein BDD12DRAFT_853546 [Trichophaea hybrida]